MTYEVKPCGCYWVGRADLPDVGRNVRMHPGEHHVNENVASKVYTDLKSANPKSDVCRSTHLPKDA